MLTGTKTRARSKPRLAPAHRRKPVVGNELRALRHRFGMSQTLLSRLLDMSLRTLSGAEAAGAVPQHMQRSVTQVVRLCDALGEAMQSAFVARWLDQPNEMLGNLKPVEAIERGQVDLVWQVVEGLRSGSQL